LLVSFGGRKMTQNSQIFDNNFLAKKTPETAVGVNEKLGVVIEF